MRNRSRKATNKSACMLEKQVEKTSCNALFGTNAGFKDIQSKGNGRKLLKFCNIFHPNLNENRMFPFLTEFFGVTPNGIDLKRNS